ncbi:hypothetical protein B0H11DRAFT_2262784 [Mycena galericulata]|nr:hypothetical protein B0H11DRAFT_2262784 [Mycena galericulata]
MPSKKPRKKILKENRRNLRLWAEGARETVLIPHIEPYADALDRGWRAERDYLKRICNEFHACISWKLEDHEEPELPLPEFDPNEMLVEDEMDDEEETAQGERILKLNKRIRRWFKYRVRRLRKQVGTRLDPRRNPWAILLAQLSGHHKPPKARQAYQQFMHEEFETKIEPEIAKAWAKKMSAGSNVQTKKEPNAPFRAEVARRLFAALSSEEQAGYAERAKSEAAERREAYVRGLKEEPSKSPEDRQKCIDSVGTFLGPILEGVAKRTGLHSVVILGGPIPKFAGELRTIYVSYGRNKTAASAHFPQWGKERFEGVLELMKEYLRTAFTAEDIEEMKLPDTLAGANYTIPPDSDDDNSSNDSESDSESGSDSESDSSDSSSDSNADSDDTDRANGKDAKKKKANAKKKAKAAKKKAEKGKKGPKAGKGREKERVNGKGKAKEKEKEDEGGEGKGKKGKKGQEKIRRGVANSSTASKRPAASAATSPRKSRRLNNGDRQAGTADDGEERMDGDTRQPILTVAQPTTEQTTPPTPRATVPSTAQNSMPPAPPATQATPTAPAPAATSSAIAVASQPSVPVVVPSDAPPWLRDGIQWLSATDLGCHFASLLVALINLEGKYGYEKDNRGQLPAIGRPSQVHSWIKGGRYRMKFPPTIGNVAAYASEWWTWWDTLQPAWRQRGQDNRWTVGGTWGMADEWDPLEAPGPNGCLSVVAALYFWGIVLHRAEETRGDWERAVQDVAWMLEGLAASIE